MEKIKSTNSGISSPKSCPKGFILHGEKRVVEASILESQGAKAQRLEEGPPSIFGQEIGLIRGETHVSFGTMLAPTFSDLKALTYLSPRSFLLSIIPFAHNPLKKS